MHFISNGDFGFPFTWPIYALQQFFVWSFQNGAANPNGIIRMPGRLGDALVFALFGNTAMSYFFLFSSLLVIFFAFYIFAGSFLGIKQRSYRIIGALFFTCNPIFLGNVAKVGLLLAAAMLPLCFVAIRKTFETKRLSYLFLWVVLLNISLIHPFTFAVNFLLSGGYVIFLARKQRTFIRENMKRLVQFVGIALLLNAYFLLPLMSMHTISKDVLSNTISSTPTDYTALVNVLNTGTVYTGLSLSKNLLLDFRFYNDQYSVFYFVAVFGFYAILLTLYLQVAKRFSNQDRRRFIFFLASLLTLVILATVTIPGVSQLIDWLIRLPGGWAFRSPLKWQLYIPLCLFTVLVISLRYIKRPHARTLTITVLLAAFVLMNGFLSFDIYKRLLVPRTVSHFSALQKMDLNQKTIIMVTNSDCDDYAQNNPSVMTEFNEVMNSKNTQLKRVSTNNVSAVNLSSFDYVLGCEEDMVPILSTHTYDFHLTHSFAGSAFQLYSNQRAQDYVYTPTTIFGIHDTSNINGLYAFTTKNLQTNFNYVTNPANPSIFTGIQDIFSSPSFSAIGHGVFTSTSAPLRPGTQSVVVKTPDTPLFYKVQGTNLQIATSDQDGYQAFTPDANSLSHIDVTLPANHAFTTTYTDESYNYTNLIPNADFSHGLWQKQVSDCYAYDATPLLHMSLDTSTKTTGTQSLKLLARNHIACTGPNSIAVQAGKQYVLSFDYRSPNKDAGYYIGMDGKNTSTSISNRLADGGTSWHHFTKVITIPSGMRYVHIQVYAYPDGSKQSGANYDNFQFAQIPTLQDTFYLVSQPTQHLSTPGSLTYHVDSPTKTTISVHGATNAFYVATSESYSDQWRLELNNSAANAWIPVLGVQSVGTSNHAVLNDLMNGWIVTPATLCGHTTTCAHNKDGSYDFQLVMEYVPQRWFVLGCMLSGVTLLGVTGYYGSRHLRRKGN